MNIPATFIKGLVGDDPILHTTKPYVIFIGRSNVGKSSLINSLVGTKGMAKSSKTPGRTLQMNVFSVADKVFFLDFPGYGYARVDQKQREKIRKMILWYITSCDTLDRRFMVVIDSKVGITEYEEEVIAILREYDLDFYIIANKIDKLNQSAQVKLVRAIMLHISEKNCILYSSLTHRGRKELLDILGI